MYRFVFFFVSERCSGKERFDEDLRLLGCPLAKGGVVHAACRIVGIVRDGAQDDEVDSVDVADVSDCRPLHLARDGIKGLGDPFFFCLIGDELIARCDRSAQTVFVERACGLLEGAAETLAGGKLDGIDARNQTDGVSQCRGVWV